MKFLAALIPMLKNLLIKLLSIFGLTAITYVGLEQIVNMFKSQITSFIKGVPSEMLQLFYLSGGGVALNILFGGFAFWLSIQTLTKLSFKLKG